jgi:serine-type D-Ala-D-Ala carboxypeptidase/endopeptidase (penicillin-binding protein 4)
MRNISVFILFFIPFIAFGQPLAQKIASKYQLFAKHPSLQNAGFSFTVLNAQTGNIVFAANQNLGLAPASTLKTITAATALQLLGPNFTYTTTVGYTGAVINQTLQGNLIITGTGDPTLGSPRWGKTTKKFILKAILQALISVGIKNINGQIIIDDTSWNTQSLPDGWLWQDIGNYYGAPTSAVCWGENQFQLALLPGATMASAVSLKNKLPYPFLTITNEVVTDLPNTGDNVFAYSAPYTNTIYLRGSYGINLKKEIGVSLPDPAYAMAYDVQLFLAQNNMIVKSSTTARLLGLAFPPSAKAVNILTLTSPPLTEIVYHLNQKSINLYAEQLLRTLAITKGKNATFGEGIKVLQNYWEEANISPSALHIYDGSGLSPANRVSTVAMATVLYKAQNRPWFNAFYASLPSHNNMVIKSGLIADVLAYTGYHNQYCFAVMVNNYSGSEGAMRQRLFNLLDVLK